MYIDVNSFVNFENDSRMIQAALDEAKNRLSCCRT